MVLTKDTQAKIIEILNKNPQGLTISEIVSEADIHRNTASRNISILLCLGKLEMRRSGKVKIYTISKKVPVFSRLSISSEYVIQLDSNLNIIFVNELFLNLLAVSEQDLLGKNIESSGIESEFEENFSDLRFRLKAALSGIEWKSELANKKRGTVFSCHIIPTVFNDGCRGLTFLLEDITEKKRSEDLVSENERRQSRLIGNLPGMVFRCRNDSRLTMEYVSDGCTVLTGYEPSSFMGNGMVSFNDLIHSEDREKVRNSFQETIARNIPFTVSFRLCSKDGGEIRVCAQGSCIARPAGQPGLLEGFMSDITKLTRAIATLRESEEKFRTIFDHAHDMITLHGITPDGLPGQFIEVNEEISRQLKFSRQELLGMSPKDIVPQEEWPGFTNNMDRVRGETFRTFETVFAARDGTRIPVEMSSHLFDFRNQMVVLSVARDFTNHKRAITPVTDHETHDPVSLAGPADISGMDHGSGAGAAGFGRKVERALASRGYSIEQENGVESARYSLTTRPLVAIKESAGFVVRIGVAWQENGCAVEGTVIRAFISTLPQCGCTQGIYASLGGFTPDAISEAERGAVDLWDATEVLCQTNGSEPAQAGDALVSFPLASGYRELFSPGLLNDKSVILIKSRLRYIPFVAGCCLPHSKDSEEDGVSHHEDTIRFLVNMLTGEVITVDNQSSGLQYTALIRQFEQTNPAPMPIPLDEGYTVSVAAPVLSEAQVRNRLKEESPRLLHRHCPPVRETSSIDDHPGSGVVELSTLLADTSSLLEVFVPQWDIEFQAGTHIYRRVVNAGTLTIIADPVMRCTACDHETRPEAAVQPAIAICEECWQPFCKEHVIKCAVCETYLCQDHIRTCLSCGRHFCAEHATGECDVAERYQRLLTLKRKPSKKYLRVVGIVLFILMIAFFLWSIFSIGGDPIRATVSLIFFGGPFIILILSLGIFAIVGLFLEYQMWSDKTPRETISVLQHKIAPRTGKDTENAD